MKTTCRNKDIQELLPAYREQLLDQSDRSRVELHLAVCADCAKELAMLGVLADEPVPDPGEAFWAAMPGRVFREVAERRGRPGSLLDLLGRLAFPRWAWAPAIVLLLGATIWFSVRPAAVDVASTAQPDNVSYAEEMLETESIDMAELDDAQLDSLDSWAARELAALQDGPVDLFTNGLDASTDDKLAELTAQELEQLSDNLDEYEYEEEG